MVKCPVQGDGQTAEAFVASERRFVNTHLSSRPTGRPGDRLLG